MTAAGSRRVRQASIASVTAMSARFVMHAPTRSFIWVMLSIASIGSCGEALAQNAGMPPERGVLIDDPPAGPGSYAVSDLISRVTDGTPSRWLIRRTFAPKCDVDAYHLHYGTLGARYEPTVGSDATCRGPFEKLAAVFAYGFGADYLAANALTLHCAGDEDPVVDVDAPSSQLGLYRHLERRSAVHAFCVRAARSLFDGR